MIFVEGDLANSSQNVERKENEHQLTSTYTFRLYLCFRVVLARVVHDRSGLCGHRIALASVVPDDIGDISFTIFRKVW